MATYTFTFLDTKGRRYEVQASSAEEAKQKAEQQAGGTALRDDGKPRSVKLADGEFDPNAGEFYHVKDQGYFQNIGGGLMQVTDNEGNALVGSDKNLYQKLQSGEIASSNAPSKTQLNAKLADTEPVFQSNNVQTGGGATGSSTGSPSPGASEAAALTDQQFNEWLNSQNLSDDQRAAITSLYNAVGQNDLETAERIKKGIEAGTAYSDPYFKAQGLLLSDALERGLSDIDGDMAFDEQMKSNKLADLKKLIELSGDYASFQHLQELKDLERKETVELETLQEDMAARGFTSSSVRTRKQNILKDVYGDLREGSNKAFQYKMDNNALQLQAGERDTAAEIARLQQLAASGKLDLLRKAEADLGTKRLQELGYTGLLGTQGTTIGGELPRQQQKDALAFASNYVF